MAHTETSEYTPIIPIMHQEYPAGFATCNSFGMVCHCLRDRSAGGGVGHGWVCVSGGAKCPAGRRRVMVGRRQVHRRPVQIVAPDLAIHIECSPAQT